MTLMGKPATIIGAGGRAGTPRAQVQLHETLGETGALVMVKTGLQVMAFADQQFDRREYQGITGQPSGRAGPMDHADRQDP